MKPVQSRFDLYLISINFFPDFSLCFSHRFHRCLAAGALRPILTHTRPVSIEKRGQKGENNQPRRERIIHGEISSGDLISPRYVDPPIRYHPLPIYFRSLDACASSNGWCVNVATRERGRVAPVPRVQHAFVRGPLKTRWFYLANPAGSWHEGRPR